MPHALRDYRNQPTLTLCSRGFDPEAPIRNATATFDSDVQALRNRAWRYVNQMPDPHAFARELGAHLLFTLTERKMDPDALYFHRLAGGASSGATFTRRWHLGPPVETQTFTQLLTSRALASPSVRTPTPQGCTPGRSG
jgi:hypothetical protein